jgi:hypothetical protein
LFLPAVASPQVRQAVFTLMPDRKPFLQQV